MSKSKSKKNPMNVDAAKRIRRTESTNNDGKIPADSFGSRAERARMRNEGQS